jgi:hypothetical protein
VTRPRLHPAELRRLSFAELAVRFAFGAGISLLAGIVTTVWGARTGGLFLAFPAILLAGLTMVAEEEGIRSARDEARGAALGTLGMIAFGLVAAFTLPRWPAFAALAAATGAWIVVSAGAYLILHGSGHGADEQ